MSINKKGMQNPRTQFQQALEELQRPAEGSAVLFSKGWPWTGAKVAPSPFASASAFVGAVQSKATIDLAFELLPGAKVHEVDEVVVYGEGTWLFRAPITIFDRVDYVGREIKEGELFYVKLSVEFGGDVVSVEKFAVTEDDPCTKQPL